LDMRMDPTRGESAAAFLARADAQSIASVIRDYGEERFAGQVARALVARRDAGRPVTTTRELAEVVAGAVKTREPGQDPAARALRSHARRGAHRCARAEATFRMTRLNAVLLVLLIASAIVLVRVAHEARALFAALDRAQSEQRLLDNEHERLKAEKQAQATP